MRCTKMCRANFIVARATSEVPCWIREYDAMSTVDPQGAFRDGLNIFAYTRNSPVSYNDPFGLSASCGNVVCLCSESGTSVVPVYEDSQRARNILWLQPPWGPKSGCVTLLAPHGYFVLGHVMKQKNGKLGLVFPFLATSAYPFGEMHLDGVMCFLS